jgi:hypothetical protein
MKKYFYFFGILLIAIAMSSCSTSIAGKWSVAKYEKKSSDQTGFSLNNIGTMTFDRSGNGVKDISYELFNMAREDKIPFRWKTFDDYLTIDSKDSDFNKTWIITKSSGKILELKATDGGNQIQVIELRKTKE